MGDIKIKRIYEAPSPADGMRVLVDRLWPRGVSKARAQLDAWLKDVAPSDELRQWFDHRVDRWDEFRRRYRDELAANPATQALRDIVSDGPVTLLFGAKDTVHNEAVVLAELLSEGAAPT
ncbi:MAG TPA: DUF488 domain-containing protein [Caulobacteraceae bacterium]|jgi:uncharacterized protein YeaO (DUF488 family)|nr:DUF488 domain-containing protein [Caulobacteraceae bacterium]